MALLSSHVRGRPDRCVRISTRYTAGSAPASTVSSLRPLRRQRRHASLPRQMIVVNPGGRVAANAERHRARRRRARRPAARRAARVRGGELERRRRREAVDGRIEMPGANRAHDERARRPRRRPTAGRPAVTCTDSIAERRLVARQRDREPVVARIGVAELELRVRVDAGDADDLPPRGQRVPAGHRVFGIRSAGSPAFRSA